jgi:hypothetical protein
MRLSAEARYFRFRSKNESTLQQIAPPIMPITKHKAVNERGWSERLIFGIWAIIARTGTRIIAVHAGTSHRRAILYLRAAMTIIADGPMQRMKNPAGDRRGCEILENSPIWRQEQPSLVSGGDTV